jgi:hypothetical protein
MEKNQKHNRILKKLLLIIMEGNNLKQKKINLTNGYIINKLLRN